MKRVFWLSPVLLLLWGCSGVSGFPDAGKPLVVKTRPGVEVKVAEVDAAHPTAVLIMMPGGDGTLSPNGPAAQFYKKFVARGLSVAVVGPPSDHPSGIDPAFRQSPAHLRDVEAVIAHYRTSTRLPVWLWGISRGTISVANVATNGLGRPDGFIFLSSTIHIPRRLVTTPLLAQPFGRIHEPVFAAGDRGDACHGSPPEGAARIVARAVNARRKESKVFSGAVNFGRNPCGPGTPHTFEGIQDRVAAAIVKFIKG